MSRFYTTSFGECTICKKPATKEVRGPYNASYGKVCSSKKCENKRLSDLERTHNDTPQTAFPRQ